MRIFATAALAVVLGGSTAGARFGVDLAAMGTPAPWYVQNSDELRLAADLPIARDNLGRCNWDPPRLALIRKSGVYYYEFCNYPALPNYVWADVHQSSGSGGDMGGLIQSLALSCSGYAALLTQKAKDWFCHD